ncbi:hypothetical protein M0Q97_07710 [Candidatus Dojkabacteria bacterium]|jgi:hypothetical protein|nr:hypothetical protein [Candidatus Dojkabacteria bacterium]
MKFLLEFAKFRDIVKSKDNSILTIINSDFLEDERLIFSVKLTEYNKEIILKWNNDNNHSIIDRIKSRTRFNSVSSFNIFIDKVFNDLFNNHFEELDEDARYGLYLKNNNFFILIDIVYNDLFHEFTQIYIPTITISSPDIYKIIEIDDENF